MRIQPIIDKSLTSFKLEGIYRRQFKMMYRVENVVGKGENAGHQHFLLFPQCFQMASSSWGSKSRHCVVKGFIQAGTCPKRCRAHGC